MKYIMITDFDNHWNKIKGNYTSYSPGMLKDKELKENIISGTPTIFIKKEKFSGEVEAVWIGKIHDIQKIPGSIFFRVEIEDEIDCPAEYADYENGWYIEKNI